MKNRLLNLVRYWSKFLTKQFLFFISRPYYFIRTAWPVWYYVLNREGRSLYKNYPQEMNSLQKRIVKELKQDGIAVAHLDDFFPGQNLLSILQQYVKELRNATKGRKHGKSFLLALWEEYPVIDLSNPLIKLALTPAILDTVNAYLDLWSKLRIFTLNITLPVNAGAEEVQSQRWHRDPEDKKTCKVFLYLNDVDEGAGPFNYVLRSQYGGRWRKLFPQRPPKGVYPPEGAVERVVPQKDIKVLTGRAGTIIFCDTSGLHKGGYAAAKQRIMFTAGFNSEASLWKILYRYPENWERQNDGLSQTAQYALKN